MRRKFIFICALALAFVMTAVHADAKKRKSSESEIKYVFYFIGDGMGINVAYGAELYNRATGYGPENLNFLNFPVRTMITTHSATSLVTDSAAAGSAFATGQKANDYTVGVDVDMQPVSSILEWAKAQGYGTGIATSVGINHATPAAFCAHQPSRNNYSEIIEDYVAGEVDFMAGSGIYANRKKGRSEDESLKYIVDAGITVLRGEDMKRSEDVHGRLLCLNASGSGELKFAIDRKDGDTGLCDFVDAGIDYLDARYGDKGFIFMIEGGKIDYAAHSDDVVGAFHEVNDFAAAIDMALDFYEEHPDETLIVVTADHETGGLILGAGEYRVNPERLAWQKESEDALTHKFISRFEEKEVSYDAVKVFLEENLGLWRHVKVSREFEDELKATVDEILTSGEGVAVQNLYSVNSKVIYDAVVYLAEEAGFSWAHDSHSGSPLGLYVYGAGAEAFMPCRDNTDVPKMIAKVTGYKML